MAHIVTTVDRFLNPDVDSESYRMQKKKDWFLTQWLQNARKTRTGYDLSMVNIYPTVILVGGYITSLSIFFFISKKTHKDFSAFTASLTTMWPSYLAFKHYRTEQANAFMRANFHTLNPDVQRALRNFEMDQMDTFLPPEYESLRLKTLPPISFDI